VASINLNLQMFSVAP